MSNLLLNTFEYGQYISILKLGTFLVLFFLWLPLVGWVYSDADRIETNRRLWTAVVLGTGVVAALLWMVVEIFVIGLTIYLVAVGTTAIVYVKYRNARVLEYERVLTAEHIKSFFSSSEQEKLDSMKNFLFITANNNEIPMPRPKTTEFTGYRTAYDILNDATWRRADSVLFVPRRQEYKVAYQVDGATLRQPAIEREQAKYFIGFIKSLADLNTKEKRKPQSGHFKISRENETATWQVFTAGSTAGEQIQLKLVTRQEIARFSDIGLEPGQLAQLSELRNVKQGLFLVTGPKKSGVTTTFYSMLRNHDAFLNSIDTLEAQLSADLPNINQHTFSLSDTGTTTFDRKLLSIVRMGPDIIGVSGDQNPETAKVICNAVKENILVYLTLEADSVLKALVKWIQLVGDKEKALKPLLGISNQRLLRKLCGECKQAYAPNKELLRKFNLPVEKVKVFYRPGKVQYDKHGKPVDCEDCQATGFIGRTGIFETIRLDEQIKEAIMSAKQPQEIAKSLRNAKMLYLQERGLKKVIAGVTAVNEMIRVLSAAK